MKKKLIITVAIVLVLCMTCGLLLAACNKDDDTGGGSGGKKPVGNTETWEVDSGEQMLKEVYNKIAANINAGNGRDFVADFDITLNIDDQTAANNDLDLRFLIRGSINVNEGNESAFIIQVSNVIDPDNEEVYFGLAYDGESIEEDETPYLYINIANGGYKKINGFSLTTLVDEIIKAMNKDESGTTTASGGFDFQTILNNIKADPTSIFGVLEFAGLYKGGTMKDYGKVYELELDINTFFDTIFGIVSDILPPDSVSGVISAVNSVLGTEFTGMADVKTFISGYLQRVQAVLTITFDEDDNFVNGNVAITYYDEALSSIEGQYTLSVNKAVLNLGDIKDVFAGTGLTDDVKAQAPVNLFNFTLDAVVKAYNTPAEDAELGEAVGEYVIDIDVDVDPFVALGIIGDGSQTNIEKYLKQLGKFSITLKKGDVTLVDVHSNNAADGTIESVYVKVIGEKTGASAIIDKEFTVMEIIQAFDEMIKDIKKSQTASGAADESTEESEEKFDFNELINKVKEYYNLAKPFIGCISFVEDASGKVIGIDINVNGILDLAGSEGYDINNAAKYDSLKIEGGLVRILFSDITAGFGNAFATATQD